MSGDIAGLRGAVPAVETVRYLNTGTSGPLLRAVGEAVISETERELALGRQSLASVPPMTETLRGVRGSVALLLHAAPEEIAVMHSSTDAINTVLWSIPWQAGDEIITTSLENVGLVAPLAQLRNRTGIAVRTVILSTGAEPDLLTRIEALCGPRTRLIALSHVTYSSGAVLPVAAICSMARERGIRTLVDGAQSAGVLPVDVTALGADFYTVSGQKWLCGPEGTGALWVNNATLPEVSPAYLGYRGMALERYTSDDVGRVEVSPLASRFEIGTDFMPAFAGFRASLDWFTAHADDLGLYERIRSLASYAIESLGEIPGGAVLTPAAHAGLVSLHIPGVDTAACVAYLASKGTSVRAVASNDTIRVSCGWFNIPAEIDALLGQITRYLKEER